MFGSRYKNDYKIHKDLQDFANTTVLGRALKPCLKSVYAWVKPYLPYPRDFLLRKLPVGAVCLEIGVYEGVFSERIMRMLKPKRLYLVDPWSSAFNTGSKVDVQSEHDRRYERVIARFKKEIAANVIHLLRKTSDEAVLSFTDGELDFVYIDGDHSYEQVMRDLVAYYPKVKPGGYLCGDDYHYATVRQAVDEFVSAHALLLETRDDQFYFRKPTTRKP